MMEVIILNNLTRRQNELLDVIKKYIASNGFPPTVRELCDELGLSSPATVQVHLNNLEEKGLIAKSGTKNRAIKLLVENELIPNNDKTTSIPLLGVVSAGSPIEAIENPTDQFEIPITMIPTNKKVFALNVSGDSMIEAGIFDGDIVIVKQENTARNGQKVVAMTDEHEVTLKTYYKEDNRIRLQPENSSMEPMYFTDVKILGIATGLYRQL